MDFPDGYLPLPWLAAGWIALAPLAAWLLLRARRARLDLNLWLASCALAAALWLVRAGVQPALTLHFVGAAALYLMFGAPLAIAAIGLVALVAAALGAGGWQALPWQVLLEGALPVGVVHLARRTLERRLPPNPFVYFIGVAYLGAGLSLAAVAGATGALHALAGRYTVRTVVDDYLAYALLLAFGEAFLTGMLITLFVVYRREWVATFDDAHWLRRRR
ncbi:MAG: energy-coupling factor ABC transporter permease [Betaproteobacteria bacterium]|nr:energy-coupling factor ABC transporter permease [Betaproteobacteria bacterium]